MRLPIRDVIFPLAHRRARGIASTWFLHWLSAALIIFILVTSIPSSFAWAPRPFGLHWLSAHMTVGILVLALAFTRLLNSNFKVRFIAGSLQWVRLVLKIFLMFLSLAIPVTGLLIFQQPPLGKPVQLFGLLMFPQVFSLKHSIHMTLINVHIFASCALLGMLLAHILLAFARPSASSNSLIWAMLWPWKR